MTAEKCACVSDEAYDCWSRRYHGVGIFLECREIEADGGPCQCVCHELSDDDEPDWMHDPTLTAPERETE